MSTLTHLRDQGGVHMVDVSQKSPTERKAVSEGVVHLGEEAFRALVEDRVKKGDVLHTAQLAGIMGAKETARLIPLCHSIALDAVDLTFQPMENTYSIKIQCTVCSCDRTGVEMEALTAVSVAALTIYDMCKSISKAIRITDIRLISKDGGQHGHYCASDTQSSS